MRKSLIAGIFAVAVLSVAPIALAQTLFEALIRMRRMWKHPDRRNGVYGPCLRPPDCSPWPATLPEAYPQGFRAAACSPAMRPNE